MFDKPFPPYEYMCRQEFEISTTNPPRTLNFADYNLELILVSLNKLDKPKSLAYFLIFQQFIPRFWTLPSQHCAPSYISLHIFGLMLLLGCLSVTVFCSTSRLPHHSSRTTIGQYVIIFLGARLTHIFIGHTSFIRLHVFMYYR